MNLLILENVGNVFVGATLAVARLAVTNLIVPYFSQ